MKQVIALSLICLFVFGQSHAENLSGSLALLPIHSELSTDGQASGGFVDVVNAMAQIYQQGTIQFNQQPFARSISAVSVGRADFHIPLIRPDHLDVDSLPFAFADECITKVPFVLYTLEVQPSIKTENLSNKKIETLRGHKQLIPFSVQETNTVEIGMRKLLAGHIDGYIMEQEAVDRFLIENKVKAVRRQLYAEWDSCVVIPKGTRGEKVNRIISGLLRELKKSGRLQAINKTIHQPYDDWQPKDL